MFALSFYLNQQIKISDRIRQGIKQSPMTKNYNITETCSLAVLIGGSLTIAVILCLNIYLDQALFIEGVNFIYSYQTALPQMAFSVINNIISKLIDPLLIPVIFLIYYSLINRKLQLIVHMSYFLFGIYLITLLKQAFQQSRPAWYDQRIKNMQWICPKDFGNPSGHSFGVILFYQPIISDTIGYWRYRPWGVVLVLLCVLVPFSRMYLGVHSLNQILFGLSMGSVFLILFKYVYQKALYNLYWQFLLGGAKKIKLLGIFILNIISIALPMIFYYINSTTRPIHEKDLENINKQCNVQLTGVQVQGKMLQICSIGFVVFGLIYGFVLLIDEPQYRKYLLGLWQHETNIKVILKIGIFLFSALVPGGIFLLIGKYVIKNIYWRFIFYCLGTTAAGFGLSYSAPILTVKCKIMKLLDGDAADYKEHLDKIN